MIVCFKSLQCLNAPLLISSTLTKSSTPESLEFSKALAPIFVTLAKSILVIEEFKNALSPISVTFLRFNVFPSLKQVVFMNASSLILVIVSEKSKSNEESHETKFCFPKSVMLFRLIFLKLTFLNVLFPNEVNLLSNKICSIYIVFEPIDEFHIFSSNESIVDVNFKLTKRLNVLLRP